VIRVRSQASQNERVTEAMIPTVAGPPSTVHSSAGAAGSSRAVGSSTNLDDSTSSNSAAGTMFSRCQASSASSGICSMKRRRASCSSAQASSSGASASVSRMSTALILSGANPAADAAAIPRSTTGSRSRRVRRVKCSRSTVSSDTFTRVSPAARSASARRSSPIPFVVIANGMPGAASALSRTISTRSPRVSGSPPVNLTSFTPNCRQPIPTRRAISGAVSSSSLGITGSPSAGMQYVQRSEHFSVIETRRSRATRPKRSTSPSTSGRPSVDGATLGSRRIAGIPSARVIRSA